MIDPTPQVKVATPSVERLEAQTVGKVVPNRPTVQIQPLDPPKTSAFGRFFKWFTSWKMVRTLLWILHVAVVVAIVYGLWYVNNHYHLETDLLSPFPRLHPYWLPLLFVLVYAGAWFGYWFFKLLTDARSGEYPDIDDAWAEGLAALEHAGIDPREVPLFLVVGTPQTSPADFFAATKLPFAIRAEPRRDDSPVKVYATREAAFVTCEGASALARLAVLLAARRRAAKVASDRPGFTDLGPVNLLDTPAAPADVMAGEPRITGPAADTPAAPAQADEWLPTADVTGTAALASDERDRYAARLKYLCRLIAERRLPYCPVNGIIWLVPAAATESESLADQTATACRADFVAAEVGLQVFCPSAVVVCDAQELTGFSDLLRGLPEPLTRERLLGRSFPLIPGVTPDQQPGVLFSGIDWVARHLVPAVAFQRFGSEAEGNGERWSAANARVWALTAELYERRSAIVRLLGQGVADGLSRPPMLAGAYLAGTGPDERDQAFAAGVVQQLLAMQNTVSWTETAIAEETDYRRMTIIGYAATAVLVIAVVVFGYATWWR